MPSSQHPPPISFRLNGSVRPLLEEAAGVRGTTPNKLAREFVVAALEDQHSEQVLGDLEEFRAELRRLREDVADALEALLRNVSRLSPEDKEGAARWVEDHLRGRP